jgi:hypothetical protein
MRNLLALLAALCLAVLIAGWFLNWYSVVSQPAADGHRKLSIDVNAAKVGADLQKGESVLQSWLDSARRSAQAAPESKPDGAAPEPAGKPVKGDATNKDKAEPHGKTQI